MRLSDLTERKLQRTQIMYHGTSSTHMRGIIKYGLQANPPKRTYGGDPDDPQNTTGYETFGGVYLSTSKSKTLLAADDAISKFGGEPIIVVVRVVQGSANIDEDFFTQTIGQDLYWVMDEFYSKQRKEPEFYEQWESFTDYEQDNRDVVLNDLMDSATMHFSRLGKFNKRFESTLRKTFEWVLDHVEEEYIYTNNMMPIARHDPTFVSLIEELMRSIRIEKDRDQKTYNVQITRDIGFRGKNKIIRIEDESGNVLWKNPNAAND